MSNRRGFLKNIGIALGGTVVAASVVMPETVVASAPVSTEPKIPTFEECYQKALKNETLTKLEVMVYSCEMNRLAHMSDSPIIHNLRKTCSTEQEFIVARDLHRQSRSSILHYWSILHPNVQNLVNVHRYTVNSILNVALQFHDYKTT